jgi:glycosyltransferase involved in cell wall biosynthesis
MEPETSVVIPVHNGVKYLADAILSASAQLEASDEILVIDDRSTDATASILAGIAEPRLRVLASDGAGVAAARNTGLAAVRGRFVAFLDHDDLWPARRHRSLLAALKQDNTLDAAFGRLRLRFEPQAKRRPGDSYMDGRHICRSVGTALYRKSLFTRIPGFDEDLRSGGDNDFHARLTETGARFQLCDLDTLIYRRHDGNMTNDLALIRRGRFEMISRKLARARRPLPEEPSSSLG